MTSRECPNLSSKGRPWEVDSGRPQDVLRASSRGHSKHVFGTMCDHLLDAPKFIFIFLSELIRSTKSIKSNSILKVYLQSRQTSKMELFCETGEWLLSVNYFCERTSPYKFDWVLNMPLILSSNVIWHAYRSIAETKIFRLGVSFICCLYVKKEEWIGKKLYCRKIKHITSNTENFTVYLL